MSSITVPCPQCAKLSGFLSVQEEGQVKCGFCGHKSDVASWCKPNVVLTDSEFHGGYLPIKDILAIFDNNPQAHASDLQLYIMRAWDERRRRILI